MNEDDRTRPPGGGDPTRSVSRDTHPLKRPAAHVGPYRLLEKIGEGGFGEVYAAEQTEPVRRNVALKLIKPGMDSGQVIARFEAERQALAMMDHPNIAKVFDAGVTDQGRPYFVMEYVFGVPITDYCDKRRLDTKERLELFECVCAGVQHAHQKAVLHRDIKPTNILVADIDGKPLPKIIDFGVAKATTQKLTEKTMHTALGQVVGTPEYMSPEQADLTSEDVDTRTDVYSLGVVLYQLLVGGLPFEPDELRQAGIDGIVKTLREKDPPRPSTKLSTLGERTTEIARSRRTEPRRLAGQLKGDLDWIVMRCLEKDRNRRYGSPQELAQDIRRHLSDEPVLAGPPGVGYRTRKFVRRHRVAVGVASIVMVIVLLAGTALTYALLESNRQRAVAEQSKAEAVAVRDFLKEMLKAADPHEETNPDIMVREAIERAAATVEERFGQHPLVEAEIQQTIGEMALALSIGDKVNPLHAFRRAYSIRDSLLGPDDGKTLESLAHLAVIVEWSGETEEGERLHRMAVETALRVFGPDDSTTCEALIAFGRSLARPGRFEEAESCLVRAARILDRAEWTRDRDADWWNHLRNGLYFVHYTQGNHPQAAGVARASVEAAEKRWGPLHPLTLTAKHNLGMALMGMHRFGEAAALLEQVLSDTRQLYGPQSTRVGQLQKYWADCLLESGRAAEAEALLRTLVDMWNEYRSTPDGKGPSGVRVSLALATTAQGRTAEAHREIREVIDELQAEAAPHVGALYYSLFGYGRVLTAMDSLRAAVSIFEESARIAADFEGHGSLTIRRNALLELARVFDRLGETERAEECRSELPAYLLEADAAREAGPTASRP